MDNFSKILKILFFLFVVAGNIFCHPPPPPDPDGRIPAGDPGL